MKWIYVPVEIVNEDDEWVVDEGVGTAMKCWALIRIGVDTINGAASFKLQLFMMLNRSLSIFPQAPAVAVTPPLLQHLFISLDIQNTHESQSDEESDAGVDICITR